MPTPVRRRTIPPIIMICGVITVVLLMILMVVVSIFGGSRSRSTLSNVVGVELGNAWTDAVASKSTKQEQQDYISSSLEQAKQLGANTVLLTGRTSDGSLLMRVKEKDAPSLAANFAENDSFFSEFDPLKYIEKQAAAKGIQIALIATDDGGTPLADASQIPSWLQDAANSYGLSLYTVQDSGSGLAVYQDTASQYTLLRMDQSPGMLAATYQQQPGSGVILGSLENLTADSTNATMFLEFVQSGDSLPDIAYKEVPQTLAIISPEAKSTAYTDEIYLMGTSDPSQPLTVNGQQVERQGTMGVWGLAVTLAEGDNQFTAQQGDQQVSVTVTKPSPSSGGGGTATQPQSDGSVAAQPGQKVQVTSTLASLLSDYTNPDTITMTVYKGAVAQVVDSVSFVSGNKTTYAYQLANGFYLLAKDCTLLDTDSPDASFTGVTASSEGNLEYLTFTGSGTPLYTHEWEGNTLTLHFYSASFAGNLPQDLGFEGATATVTPEDYGFTLEINFTDSDPLWGYFVDYLSDGTSRLALKHQPRKSGDPAKPLTGITVMLDPGHGDTDMGAPGTSVSAFPTEKDLNLSAALAAKYRLEQLGATVLMTRDTDVFYELGERMDMLNQQKPDFFISIHHNSVPFSKDVTDITGTEAYWFYTEGKTLASNLVASICNATSRKDRGDVYNYFYVTRSNICPAVLLELGFVSSPSEYQSCADLTDLWAEGGSIAQAVVNSIPS